MSPRSNMRRSESSNSLEQPGANQGVFFRALHIQACESSGVADGRTVVVPREQGWGVGGVEDPCNLHIVLDIGENGGLNEVALVAHALPA